MRKHFAAAPAALLVLGLTGCATIQARATRSTEQMLAAAGLHIELADTPAALAHLQTLPPRKITVERRGAEPSYVYADPDVCVCTYVGTESQYHAYGRLVLEERQLADERLQTAASWGPWGPWSWGSSGTWPWW